MNGMRLCVFLLLSALLLPGSGVALDRGADGKFDQRRSAHFRLLQDVDIDRRTGRGGSRQFEQAVIEALEDAFRQVHQKLDIRPRGRVDVVVYDPAVFDGTYSDQFRFSAVGFYDGVIHVRGNVKVDPRLVRTLHHEYFHAALDAVTARGRVPAWLNEGLAEWFEARALGKRRMSAGQRAYLNQASQSGGLYTLADLSRPSLAYLGPEQAALAYLQSYAFVEFLARRYGERSLREFCLEFLRTGNLARAFARSYRGDWSQLEEAFRSDLGAGAAR